MLLAVDDGLISGNLNLADILFLVAFVLFVVAAVLEFIGRAWAAAFIASGLAVGFLGLLVL